MYALVVATLEAAVLQKGANGSADRLTQRAMAERPTPGLRFKFIPEDGKPLQPGTYLIVGKHESGVFVAPDTGRSVAWVRVTGLALPCSLDKAETALSSALSKAIK